MQLLQPNYLVLLGLLVFAGLALGFRLIGQRGPAIGPTRPSVDPKIMSWGIVGILGLLIGGGVIYLLSTLNIGTVAGFTSLNLSLPTLTLAGLGAIFLFYLAFKAWKDRKSDVFVSRLMALAIFGTVVGGLVWGYTQIDWAALTTPDVGTFADWEKFFSNNLRALAIGLALMLFVGTTVSGVFAHLREPGNGSRYMVTIISILSLIVLIVFLLLGDKADVVRKNIADSVSTYTGALIENEEEKAARIKAEAVMKSVGGVDTSATQKQSAVRNTPVTVAAVPLQQVRFGYLGRIENGEVINFILPASKKMQFDTAGNACVGSKYFVDYNAYKPDPVGSPNRWEIPAAATDREIELRGVGLGLTPWGTVCN